MSEGTDGGNTQCLVGPQGNTETEDWLATTLPGFVTSPLRADHNRESCTMAGYVSGG